MAVPGSGRVRRLLRSLLRRSAQPEGAPLNRISLLLIVLIDLFLVVNLVTGMAAITDWPLTPQQAYPCQGGWSGFQANRSPRRDLEAIEAALPAATDVTPAPSLQDLWQADAAAHLGRLDEACLTYAGLSDRLAADPRLRGLGAELRQRREEITRIESASATIRQQYDSTLLERIAGQPRERSLHPVAAADARRRLEANAARVAALNGQIEITGRKLLADPASQAFLAFLKQPQAFAALEQRYARALFWFPSLQLLLQALFLLPLLLGSFAVHRRASRRGHDLVALISWHLLVILLIAVLLKLLEFAQVGVLITLLAAWIRARLGDLLFLISYLRILLIPLLGYGLIQLLQKLLFHPRRQAMVRLQSGRCLHCARRLPAGSAHCPFCGTGQLQPCPACGRDTHRLLPYCRHCGSALEPLGGSPLPSVVPPGGSG